VTGYGAKRSFASAARGSRAPRLVRVDRSAQRAPWRSLAHRHPELVAELHPMRNGQLDPAALAAASKRQLWWRCSDCGHEWQATPANRTLRLSGCPACAITHRAASQARVTRDRSLQTNRPNLAAELHPSRNVDIDPWRLATYSTRRVWWLCPSCGHQWRATPANRVRGATGCPRCWARRRAGMARAVPLQRSLAARNPPLAAELDPDLNPGIDSSRLGACSDQKLWWHCPSCQHCWRARVADRSAGTGCPACGHRAPAKT
jgi:rubrerythrin